MRNKRFSKFLPCKYISSVTLLSSLVVLSACGPVGSDRYNPLDVDRRNNTSTFDTTTTARQTTVSRPSPDSRGVISYPTYQVAVAQRGDTLQSLATRVGLPADGLASFNGLRTTDKLNAGEIVALPKNLRAPSAAGTIQVPVEPSSAPRDITEIATTAIDNAKPEVKLTALQRICAIFERLERVRTRSYS